MGAGIEERAADRSTVEAHLHGFDVNSDRVPQVHQEWLKHHVVPLLAAGGSVTVVGMASRTGKGSLNQALSERRADAVIKCLRAASQGRGVAVRFKYGVGESEAAHAGQADGTESSYYRAVQISAWDKPVPPPPPLVKKPAGEKVKRVTSRRWYSVDSGSSGGGGNPWQDGGAGALLADLIRKEMARRERGGTDERTYAWYPKSWVVVLVQESFTLSELRGGPVVTRSYDTRIKYHWGPPRHDVTLIKEIRFETNGAFGRNPAPRVNVTEKRYPRTEIWRHTTSPTQPVFG